MFPEKMMDPGEAGVGGGAMMNPRDSRGYLSQPAHDGTSNYSNTEKQNTVDKVNPLAMPKDKTLNFNKTTRKMELI